MKHSSNLAEKVAANESLFRFEGKVPAAVFARLPELRGRRISVRYRPCLTAWRGKLLSNALKGDAVYAGCFLRKRRIVLEEQMLRTPRVLERIFVHEIFHFVWSKLGNPLRLSYEALIMSEMRRGARGELGWSAESMKLKLMHEDVDLRTARWKDYLCESFCDTAGWHFGSARNYSEMTLARRFREGRKRWFAEHVLPRSLAI